MPARGQAIAASTVPKAPGVLTPWDAPSAVRAAVRAAGPRSKIFVADFALRLARLGHVKEISVDVAGGVEAREAVRAVLAELTSGSRALPEAAQDAPGDSIPAAVESQAVPEAANALASVRKRARRCLTCGRDFEVNLRHADKHRFCSGACRSRHRRNRRR
jgi:hypothetical protein